jgi:hypothetical protein
MDTHAAFVSLLPQKGPADYVRSRLFVYADLSSRGKVRIQFILLDHQKTISTFWLQDLMQKLPTKQQYSSY